jgi:nucleotide-binding universal stress UspA family protein
VTTGRRWPWTAPPPAHDDVPEATVMTAAPAHSIVVGIDGSPPSGAALTWAALEAIRRRLPLHILHSYVVLTPYAGGGVYTDLTGVETRRVESAAQLVLDAAVDTVRRLAPGVEISAALREGSGARALVEASSTADTVVVGARGRGPLTAAVLGSVSLQVAMHAHAPVIVVKGPEDPERVGDRVVVGVDGSADSQTCLGYGFEQAATRGTALEAVHAWSADPAGRLGGAAQEPATERMETQGQLLLSEALAGWALKYPDVEVRRSVVHDHPVTALLGRSDGADLLVVGSRGLGGFAGLMLGSVSQGLLQEADCPVAVVRSEPHR